MSERYTPAPSTTGTGPKKRSASNRSWIQSLKHIDRLRAEIDGFLTPLLRKTISVSSLPVLELQHLLATSLRHGYPVIAVKF